MSKILFIDDNPEVRRLISDSLRNICEVVVAETGEEGITMAVRERPAMVLIDLMLPGINGYDVLMKLRTVEYLRDIPIFAITAHGREETEFMARGLGFDQYILKPVEIGRFRELVKSYLSGEVATAKKSELPEPLQEYSVDLIDRLQTTIEALHSEKKFTESIIRSLSSGLMVLDLEHRIAALNPEGENILAEIAPVHEGMKLEDVFGAPVAEAMTEISRDILCFRNEVALTTRTGGLRMIGYTTVPRENSAGEKVGTVVSFRDITDIIAIEKELEKLNRFSTLAEIAAAVAHEIRNPLAGIRTMAQAVDENLAGEDENKEYIGRIVKQVDRLHDILKGFFAYARPAKPKCERTSVQGIMREVKPLVQSKLAEKGIVCAEEYDQGLPDILADPNQIQQVFLNLFLNSIDAVPSAGRISVRAGRVQSSAFDAGRLVYPPADTRRDAVMVRFSDNGIGIPRDMADKIFEPFFTTKPAGSGLGLSIVYRILRENKATVYVESTEGKGTTFIMIFRDADTWEKFSS